MTSTLVDISGFITDANLVCPQSDFFSQPKYKLSIQPTYSDLMEIEARIEDIKRMNEDPYAHQKLETYSHKDACLSGCNLLFENIKAPRLVGSLKSVQRDEELVGKYVNVVGNIQVLPDGNAYIGFFQVQDIEHVIEDLEFINQVVSENDF